ncbi:MAG: cytochrome c oxidase assembly factor Coa1 family protein [Kofleriaceae bacterium]
MKWTFGQKALVGLPFVVIVAVCVLVVAPAVIASSPGATESMRLVRACPRAVELLGKNIEPKRTGFGCGCGDESGSHGMLRIGGSKTTGVLEYTGIKDGQEHLSLTSAELLVDTERIDLLACAGPRVAAPPPPPPPPASPPPDPAAPDATEWKPPVEDHRSKLLFRFIAIVDRTTHPTLMPDVECIGTVEREAGAWKAFGKIVCGSTTIYTGTSPIIIDHGAENGQLRLEYYDDARPTKAKLSFSDTHDIVRLWSTEPVWEVDLKVTVESTK